MLTDRSIATSRPRTVAGALLCLALWGCADGDDPAPPALGAALAADAAGRDVTRRAAADGMRLVGDWSCIAVAPDGSVRRERVAFGPDGGLSVTDVDGVRHGRWERSGDVVTQRLGADGPVAPAAPSREGTIRRLDRDALRFAVTDAAATGERVHHCTDAALVAGRERATASPAGDGARPVPGAPRPPAP